MVGFAEVMLIVMIRCCLAAPLHNSAGQALNMDDQCVGPHSSHSTDCTLSARQLRSEELLGKSAVVTSVDEQGSCRSYGCGSFGRHQSCQCNHKCQNYKDCCHDYKSHCVASNTAATCRRYGCTGYVSSQSCQCNDKCQQYGNCCSDFQAQCASEGSVRHGRRMPSGVNLGGWFVLEDWFFSGSHGHHVMTTGTVGQGRCLPPMLSGSDETWPSEGLLTKKLENSRGKDGAVEVLDAHRKSYITDKDLEQIAGLGVGAVRLPLPWTTFADALSPLDPQIFAQGATVVPDPFYTKEASFVTLNRGWVARILRKCAELKLKVYLDIHTMPGGSSDATYSGVWPLKPQFWTGHSHIGKKRVALTEVGLWVVSSFISWVEQLGEPEFSAVAGLTLLNEPAHMSHIDAAKGKAFTRSEQQVMDWVAEASDLFRKSSLPHKGLKLHVSIIESAFKYFWDTAPAWWSKTFTAAERHSWAVFDVHFYDAWTPKCSGRMTAGGGYTCNQPVDEIRSIIRTCHENYMSLYASKIKGLKACTEFSVATFENPVKACNEGKLLNMYLEEQVKVFQHYQVESFFWTWRMPYGRNFESAWSFKHLMGLERATETQC